MRKELVHIGEQILIYIRDQRCPQQQHIRARASSFVVAVSYMRCLNRNFRCQPACVGANTVFAIALTGDRVLVDVELRSTSALFETNVVSQHGSLFWRTEEAETIS